MNNILWQKPDGSYAMTSAPGISDLIAYASKLQSQGDIPSNWMSCGTNTVFPAQTLAQAQVAQTMLVSTACQTAITAGITSSALGSVYTYPTKATDQMNLTASVTASMIPGNPANWATLLWCQSQGGTWAFMPHNMAQTQKAGQDVMAGILGMMSKNANLATQIAAATSTLAAQAIIWS